MTAESDRDRLRLFDSLIDRFTPGKAIDLGAGHGKFSIRAADRGWSVTAVDARTERFPNSSRVVWREEDVRETDLTGYDLIINLGLFYHLTVDDQLGLLDRSAGTPMILDTHVGMATDQGFNLSKMVTRKGYRGRLYSEEGLQHVPTASFGNDFSFWPTPRALRRMLNERGWDVFQATPFYLPNRTFFLCLPG
jgi:hypothetical protein